MKENEQCVLKRWLTAVILALFTFGLLSNRGYASEFDAHDEAICCLSFSPDGRYLMSASAGVYYRIQEGKLYPVSASDRVVKVWDVQTEEEVARFAAHHSGIVCAAWSSDSRQISTADEQGNVYVWAVSRPSRPETFFDKLGRTVRSLAFSPDGKRLAVAADQAITIVDLRTASLSCLREAAVSPTRVTFSPDGLHLLSVTSDAIRLWDSEKRESRFAIAGRWDSLTEVAFAADGARFFAVTPYRKETRVDRAVLLDYGARLHVWSVSSGAKLSSVDVTDDGSEVFAFTPDHRHLAVGGTPINGEMMVDIIGLGDFSIDSRVSFFHPGGIRPCTLLAISPRCRWIAVAVYRAQWRGDELTESNRRVRLFEDVKPTAKERVLPDRLPGDR